MVMMMTTMAMAMASGEDDSDAMVMEGVRNGTRVKEQIHPNDIIIIIIIFAPPECVGSLERRLC